MSIGLPGRFYYTVAITGCDGGEWSGRADAPLDSTRHPGLVGDRPNLTLADGVVTLECTETEFSFRRNPHYREWGCHPR